MNKFLEKYIDKARKEMNEFANTQNKIYPIQKTIDFNYGVPYTCNGKYINYMNIFKPHVVEMVSPVIINIHGGNFISGVNEQNNAFCQCLCANGFIVYDIEYSLVPDVDVRTQLEQLNYAIAMVYGRLGIDYGNRNKVYMVGDNAGAFLTLYCVAMQKSDELASAFDIVSPHVPIKAIGLQSGIFYTRQFNRFRLVFSKMMWGKDYKKRNFFKYLNPENPEIIKNLPPTYLIASDTDKYVDHTDMLILCLEKEKIIHDYTLYRRGRNLVPSFAALYPLMEESRNANIEMIKFLLAF